jgi:aspartyl-tRNA(Asn)/glutamyl-tRNA(Gln) amidotransferase subunit A
MLSEDILYLTVQELGQRIKAGKLSPVELTEAYLKRSEKFGPRLNAYACLTRERALREAKEAEKDIGAGKYRGPLHGIPYAAKDLLAVKGYPTTWGARPYANQKFDDDATVIRKLHDAGAILIGKAAMIQLAGGWGYRYAAASLTGPCKNPWNEKHWSGGSSSGSGAIAAAALAGFAIGTETFGSIICPATFCGVSGFRPTYGAVSRHGAMALSYTMDKIGVLARSARDCELVARAMAGPDPNDASTLQENVLKGAVKAPDPLRIGWLPKAYKRFGAKEAGGLAATAVDAVKGEGGKVVEEASLPEGPWDETAGTIIAVEGVAAFEEFLASGRGFELDDPLQRLNGYVSQHIPASDYLRAMRIRAVLQRIIDKLFERFDVLAAASFPFPSTPLEMSLESDELDIPDPLGAIGNLCGLPAISVPCGFTEKNLPFGVQFVGRAMDDAKVIAAARLYQQNTDWHRKRPPLVD